MKLEVHIDPALAEARVEVYAPARTPEIDILLDRLTSAEAPLLGFRADGAAVPLDLDTVLRFYGEDKDIRVQTGEAVYTVRERLYELERRLAGTIRMTLTGGVTAYVSRRYVKKIREVLGL